LNHNRLRKSTAAAALFFLALVVPAAQGDTRQGHPLPARDLSESRQQKIVTLDDAFAGLDLSKEQRSEVQKIRKDAEARKTAIAENQALTQDQKDAMILGCMRLEYSRIFQALTPTQQNMVRERLRAWQQAEAPTQKPNAPAN
jgi:Spy/CpxP family protein refolding chaperone